MKRLAGDWTDCFFAVGPLFVVQNGDEIYSIGWMPFQ